MNIEEICTFLVTTLMLGWNVFIPASFCFTHTFHLPLGCVHECDRTEWSLTPVLSFLDSPKATEMYCINVSS